MNTITIRQREEFDASVSINGSSPQAIALTDPFADEDEAELAWYFEKWWESPTTDTVKARRVRGAIVAYGQSLFEQVLGDRNLYSEYNKLRGNLSQICLEIEGDPAFQSLHWEAMKDPELPHPFSVEGMVLRRSLHRAPVFAEAPESPTVNVLLVTARPNEDDDIGYRTTSRPLFAALKNARLPVNIVLLRPGTYEALERHLDSQPEGFYHIVHFDAHGGVATFSQIQAGERRDRFLLKQRYGRSDLAPYAGTKAFLFLEGETKGKADPVEATELANLLTGKRIPICILDACQLGQELGEKDDRRNSLGAQLMSAGMQIVVAMRYSVLAQASGQMMGKFYEELAAGKSPIEALRQGRRELYNNKERRAYFNLPIDLDDWLLPVAYYSGKLDLNLREFTPQEEEDYYEAQASRYRFPSPQYGFVGRDLEILKVEKALLRHNILLLQGMGGTGKTTLLNYLREWWQTTHFAENIFYFGYDEKAWNLEQIVFEIGKQFYNRFEQARFQAMKPTARVQKLATKLKADNCVLILDNLESVTGQELAIQNTLSELERNEVREFLMLLSGGKTKVVLGSRSAEEWLREGTFGDNRYVLKGLDTESRSALSEKILERNVAENRRESIRKDSDFKRLMAVLAGYPLAMEVVLANLKQQTPTEILQGLEAANVDLDTGDEEKTKSILKCVEYSHSNLSPTAQELLLCLAPFSGFIFRPSLTIYIKNLQELNLFSDYNFSEIDSAIDEAINWGMLSPMDDENQEVLVMQPNFPYFLNTKLHDKDIVFNEVLQQAFKSYYSSLSSVCQDLMKSKDLKKREFGFTLCKWEYENLYRALQMCLGRQEAADTFSCLFQYFLRDQDTQSQLKLSQLVYNTYMSYPNAIHTEHIRWQMVIALDRLGYCYLEEKQYSEARETYKKAINFVQQLSDISDNRLWSVLAVASHQLGEIARELGEYEEALYYYEQAFNIYTQHNDALSQASIYHNLGILAYDLREYEAAQFYCQQALDSYIDHDDDLSQAKIHFQLGRISQRLGKYEEAKVYYQQALEIFIEYDDCLLKASTYHDLGVVSQRLRKNQEAQRYHKQALDIYIEYNDRYEQAKVYHELGIIAQEFRDYEEARCYYRQALDIAILKMMKYSSSSG